MKKKSVKLVLSLIVLGVLCGAYFGVQRYVKQREEKSSDQAEDDTEEVLSLNAEDIQSLTFLVDKKEVTFVKEDGKWYKEDEREFPVDQDVLSDAASSISLIEADRILDDVANPEEYDLDSPQNTIVIHTEDGVENLVRVGMKNESTSQYYITLNDEKNKVYVVDSNPVEPYLKSLYDYAKAGEFPKVDAASITEISVMKGEDSYRLVKDSDTELWYVETEEDRDSADSSKVATLTDSVGSLSYSSFIDYNCTDESQYGFDKPYAVLKVNYQEEETVDEEDGDDKSDASSNSDEKDDMETDRDVTPDTGESSDTDESSNTEEDSSVNDENPSVDSGTGDTTINDPSASEGDSVSGSDLDSEGSLSEENPSEEGLSVEDSSEEGLSEEDPSEEGPSEEDLSEDPSEENLSEEGPSEELSTEEDSSDDNSESGDGDSEEDEKPKTRLVDKEITLYIGDEIGDDRYVKIDDSKEIYTLTNGTIEGLVDKDVSDYWDLTVNYLSVNQLVKLEVKKDGETHVVNVSRETSDSEEEDGEKTSTSVTLKYELDGTQLEESSNFTTFYNKLINLFAQQRLTETYEPENDPEMKVVFEDLNGDVTELDFYEYDANFYAAVVNQEKVYLINKMTFRELEKSYDDFLMPDKE